MRVFTIVLFATVFLFPALVIAQSNNGLVAHWAFNGNAYDSTGKGHNGTMSNVTPTAGEAGAANTAVRFAGAANSIITVPYQSDLNLSNYSICAVVKPEGFYTNLCQISMLLARGNDHGDPGAYFLNMTDNAFDSTCSNLDTNKFVFTCGGGPSNYPYHYNWADSPRIHTNKWYCVVGTFDGTAFKMYVDGVLRVTAPSQSPVPIGTSTDGLAIGGNIWGNAALYPYWYKGVMDDLRLYNRVLADSEIAHYCGPAVDTGGGDTTVHVYNVKQEISVAIVPNPSSGSFQLQGIVGNHSAEIDVYNIVGQSIYRTMAVPVNGMLNERIELANATEGIYFVKVSAGEESKTYRVVVQR